MSLQAYIVPFAFCIFAIYHLRRIRSPLRRLPLPPGPKPLPIIGNILDMPSEFIWETYDKWFKAFQSDIVYVHVAHSPIVIVNTYEAAIELFERRSSIYSSRVPLPMVGDLMGHNDWDFVVMTNGDTWRTHRRLFHQAFNTNASKQFEPLLIKATHEFLLLLVERPVSDELNLIEHIKHLTASVILDITYGLKILPDDDPYIKILERATRAFSAAATPGRFWVNFFPSLKYVPRWFPGAGFRRQADEWAQYAKESVEKPFKATQQSMKEGRFTSSFISYSLNNMESGSGSYYDEKDVQDVAAVAYAAGFDTTATALASFALAMLLYPEVQKRAQAELDEVLNGSLPSFQDKDSLPYVTAVFYETLRWKTVTPFGVPHRLISDDIYSGYRLPAGSAVIPNIWSMLHDESRYPNAAIFNPDRFLKDGKLNTEDTDPRLMTFGFGRRICPGRHLASSSIWIAIASMLVTMNISKALDKNGKVIEPSGEYISGLVHAPKPFACIVTPRSRDAEGLVRGTALSQE